MTPHDAATDACPGGAAAGRVPRAGAPRRCRVGRARGWAAPAAALLLCAVLLVPPHGGGRGGGRGGGGALAAEQRKDYYKILGVMPTAKPAELKKAYHKLSLKYHPDKNREPGAEDMFMNIAEAYEVLSDEERRRNYDNSGSGDKPDGERDGQPKKEETSHEPMELHLRFSGGDFRFNYKPPQEEKPDKAPDMVVTLDVELLDLYLGADFNVTFTRQEVCHQCHGHGAAHKRDIINCPYCHGSGMRASQVHQSGEPLGRFSQHLNTTCSKCDGSGHHINSTCPVCNGHKVLLKKVTNTVYVPGECVLLLQNVFSIVFTTGAAEDSDEYRVRACGRAGELPHHFG